MTTVLSVLSVRQDLVRALALGAGRTLVAAAAVISCQTCSKRVCEIPGVTECIAIGDLARCLPVGDDKVERPMGEVKGACDGTAHDLRTPLVHLHTLLARVAECECLRADADGAALPDHARSETGNCSKGFRAMLRISETDAATA